jgi:Icc-related predicted phosphoesterase
MPLMIKNTILAALALLSALPTGLNRFEIETNLRRLPQRTAGSEWSFAVLGDSRGGLHVLEAALGRIEQLRPAFSVFTGDLVGESTRTQWRDARAALDRTIKDVPIFPAVGNHETYGDGIRLFIDVFGNPSANAGGPIDYAFDHGGARFVMMDNSRGGIYGPEGFTDAQIAWLDRKLTDAPPLTFVAAHKPPNSSKWEHAFYNNARVFEATLEKHKVTAGLFGHIHFYDRRAKNGVTYLITGGAGAPLYHWDGHPDVGNPAIFESPKGAKAHNFAIVTVKGAKASFKAYTDQAKLATLRPKRSAGLELSPADFEVADSGDFQPGVARQ